MPPPTMDLRGLSSSPAFRDEPAERQVGFWKSEAMPNQNGATGPKYYVSSTLCKPAELQALTARSLDHLVPFSVREEKASFSLDVQESAFGRASYQSLSLLGNVNNTLGQKSYLNGPALHHTESTRVDLMGNKSENSLFSSSLSDLFSRKVKVISNDRPLGYSVGTVHYEDEELLESLEEIEARTIGNLLPDDDDLLSAINDGIDLLPPPKAGDDVDDLDIFSSVGGMDLEDNFLNLGRKIVEHAGVPDSMLGHNGSAAGEHPSRTLFVRNINSNVEDAELQELFEQYGHIRNLYTACKHRGFVMVSYYDIRSARTAMKALQNKPLRGRKLDIHYSIPKDNPSEKDINQGTLVVFNLDSSVSNDDLHRTFSVYGEIKEIRESPHRSTHKFVEFYDVRAAEAALRALNRSDVAGKRIKVEPSRPGGSRRVQQLPQEPEQDDSGLYMRHNSPTKGPFPVGKFMSTSMGDGTVQGMHSAVGSPHTESATRWGISCSIPGGAPSLMRVGSAGNYSAATEAIYPNGCFNFEAHRHASLRLSSLIEYCGGFANGINCDSSSTIGTNINSMPPERIELQQLFRVGSDGYSLGIGEVGFCGSSGNGSCLPLGHHHAWGCSYYSQPATAVWPNSPSYGISVAHPSPKLHEHSGQSHMLKTVLPVTHQNVGSAPAVNPSLWGHHQVFAGEFPDACSFRPLSLGNMNIPSKSLHSNDFVSHNMFPHAVGNSIDSLVALRSIGIQTNEQKSMIFPGKGQMMPILSPSELPTDRVKTRKSDGAPNQEENKKQFELDINRIMRGEDKRTTLMIKNIPNKYTSKILLAAIDERNRGTYDFIYLPIDFKNKCNVGYAFINMTHPLQIIPFYKAFNGKKWEKFNSEKVASLAYARIQGKAALIAHFQNSSLMNEDKRCRPILFNTEGPNAGDQVPFPVGDHVRTRPRKHRIHILEENIHRSNPSTLETAKDYTDEMDLMESLVKDLD